MGFVEFWNTVPVLNVMAAEVGLGLGMDVGREPVRVGQIPPDLPNKGQIRGERGKERKQSLLERYFNKANLSTDTTRNASDVANVHSIGPSPSEQAITQVSHASKHSKRISNNIRRPATIGR